MKITGVILRSIISLILVLFISTNAYSQLNSANLSQLTEKDGLPGSTVHQVLVDKLGFIWIGTINGLVRYDGYEFTRFYYNPNDPSSIHGLNIWSLFEDHSGQIWVSAGPSFLNRYNPATKTFRQYPYAHLIPHPANVELGIVAMCEDKKGRIYFGVHTNYGDEISQALLYKDENDDSIRRFVEPDTLPIRNVLRLITDKMGNVWMISYSGMFMIDTKGKLSAFRSLYTEFKLRNEYPNDIRFDHNNHLWMITSKLRLFDFDTQTGKYSTWTVSKPDTVKSNGFPNRIVLDKDENLWIGSVSGATFFSKATGQFSTFNSGVKKELEHSPLSDLKIDSFGNLWMCSLVDGLIKYEEKSQFKSYVHSKNDTNSITPGWISYIMEDDDGELWMTSSGPRDAEGLNKLNIHTGVIKGFPYSRFIKDAAGAITVWSKSKDEFYLPQTDGMVFTVSKKTFKSTPFTFPGTSEKLWISYHLNDSHENEWLCTSSGLYKKEKGTTSFKHYDLNGFKGSDASSNEITSVYESKKHGLWLLTNNGLFLYNYQTDKIERHGYDKAAGDIFITQDINSFYEDPDGIAWVGTWQGGLAKYNVETKKIKTYTRNDGLPSMSIQSILADEKNNTIWLSTFDGLSRFNLKTQQFNNFSIADGIQGQLFADGSFLKTKSGLMVFGGANGITIFDPEAINKNSIPPKVYLTDLKLSNQSVVPGEHSVLKKPVYETGEVILEHDQNNLSIEFVAIHYSNPSKNKYSYQLENFDNDWRNVNDQREAFYHDLPPGQYVFHVKASNNNDVWNQEGATLKITILPPWWRTFWAYIAYGLLLVMLAFIVDRYFRRRILRKEMERNRLREIEHSKEIEKAYYNLEEAHETLKSTQSQLIQSEKMASLGDLTAGIAHEIQNPLNFVNNFSEVNSELLVELKAEADKGNMNEVKAIANDLISNEQKINHHGKRADAIVKGMLQHTRSGTGTKEPTDINKLADEYLRLAYHGLRAKEHDFNVQLETGFDESIGVINIIPQDIGRVLLNLYSNAFYVITEKKKQADKNYEPKVLVTTKKAGNHVFISVSDNGNGIPQNIIDKIFQPFFTTKPAGQGTGLGLSLSYDFIKAHGGELKVETEQEKGTTFTIQLPAI